MRIIVGLQTCALPIYCYQARSDRTSGMDTVDAVTVRRDAFPRFVLRLCACCETIGEHELVLRRSDQTWTCFIASRHWRSAERSVGTERVSTCRSRGSPLL